MDIRAGVLNKDSFVLWTLTPTEQLVPYLKILDEVGYREKLVARTEDGAAAIAGEQNAL